MNKTMTRLLMWSLCLCGTTLVWGNAHHTSSDTLPPQLIQRKATGTRLAPNAILLQASGGDEYKWSTGASTSSININTTTSPQKYSVHVKRKKTHENWVIQQTVYPTNDVATSASQQLGCENVGLSWQSRVCAGTSVRVQASGGLSYEWENGETTSSITVVPTDGEIYRVTITGANGCEDVQTTASAPMEVIPVPVAQITVSNNECSAIGAILTASGGETYLWTGGQSTPSIVTEEAAMYEVRVSNGNGLCTDMESIWVSTNFQPKINGETQLCQGQGTTLTASGGNSYLWDNGATSSSITALPSTVGTHTYKVRVNAGACSREVFHTITVKSKPSAIIQGPGHTCYNGSVTLNGSGTGTYLWSTGATTSSISPSLLQNSQTYRLTVTDPSTQCSSVAEHVVSVLPRPTLNEVPNSICAGETVNLSVSGGSSYVWNVGGTTASIQHSPSSSIEYRVSVTDANGCIYGLSSKYISVINPPNITFGGGTSICAGQSLNITAFGGSSYSWSHNSANTATITVSPVVNTTYTVTATTSGCSSSAQRVIVVKPSPIGNIDAPSSICPGQNVTLTASGGNSYAWNGGASTASITVNPTQNTNYTVSISNTEGCTVVKSHAVAVNISGSASNDGPLTCSKTSATLTGTSSAQGASYRWKNASGVPIANTANTTVTTTGVYTLEITAAGGCTYSTATEVLQNLQTPSVSANNSGAITCTQSSVNLLGTSSATPATYEWRNGGGTLIANTLNTSVIQAGTYILKVTAANGCSSTASTTVTTDVATPQASIQHDGPLSCTKTSVTLSASPNNPNLQYTWRNSSGTVIASNSSSVVVTATGTYQLEAKGSNGCTTTVSTNITQSGNFPNISVNNPGQISCIGYEALISGNSTTPGVTYAWYNPNGKLMTTQKSFVTSIAGTYTLKVTSAEGCVSSASNTLGEYVLGGQAITLSVGNTYTNASFAQGELTCTQNSINISASPRYSGYNISVYWTNAAGQVISNYNFVNVSTPGYYYMRQHDCPLVKEIYIKENRPAPVVQFTGEQLVCAGTRTTLTASGGSEYYWSTGATSNTITTDYIYSPKTYTVTVSTGTYCSTTANVTVGNHPNPVININGATSLCAGAFVTLTASGGQTYKWSAGNATTTSITVAPSVPTTYTVTVTSDKGCAASKSHVIGTVKSQPNDFMLNGAPTTAFCGEAPVNINVVNPNSNYTWSWSTGETTTSIQRTITSSQTISVTATRNNGCTRTKTIPITVNPKPQGFIAGADLNCAGESTALTAPLGETYVWSTGASSSSISLQPSSSQTYNVTVSNAGGTCSTVFSKTVAVPAPLSLSHNLAGADDCIPNNVTVIPAVSGGTGNVSLGIIRSGELYVSENLSGLRSGTYLLRAEDTKGCLALDEVVIAETPVRITHINLSNLNDCTPNNVSLNVVASGSTLPFSYRLNGSNMTGTSATVPSGTHFIEVQDAIGCIARDTVVVNETPFLKFQANLHYASCFGKTDGRITTQPIQNNIGTPPYTYAWSTGATSSEISQLGAGLYSLTVTDTRACTSILPEILITQPSQMEVEVEISDSLSCFGGADAAMAVTASGGTAPYLYNWSTGATTTSIEGLSSGTYTVTVLDNQGCELIAQVSIVDPPKLMLSYNLLSGALDCTKDNNEIQTSVQHARGSVQYRIRGISTEFNSSALFSNVPMGTQIVEARDSMGCTDTLSIEVEEWVPVQITQVQMLHHTDCTPGNTGVRIVTTPSGRSLWYQKEDAAPQPVDSFSNLQKGYHQVIVSDSLGCKDTTNILVLEEAFPYYQVLSPTDCDSANAAIRFSRAAYNAKFEYSVNAGLAWSNSRTFERLIPGRYHPAVRKVDSGCIAEGDSITIGPDCPVQPRAGFVKDSIVVSDPKQLVALQWYVESPLWFKDSFSVVLLRRGQFSPHFTELSAWNSPVVVDAEYPGAVNLQQDFQLPLADTLGQHTQLTEYYFELIAPVGSPVLIDPQHKVMKVVVNFGDGCLSEPDPIVVCQGQEVRIGQTHIRNPQCIEWSHSSSEELELVFKAESEGEYTQTVVDADGNVCVAHYKVQLKNPEVSIESPQQDGACPQDQVELKAVHEGVAKKYKWELILKDEPGAAPVYMGDTRIIQVSPGFEYQLSVTFSSGCTAHANIDIEDLAESACNIKKYFEEKGFFAIPIEIDGDPQARKKPDLRDDPCAETACNGICVRDDAGLGFSMNGQAVGALGQMAEQALTFFQSFGHRSSSALISSNNQICACSDYLKKAEQRFNSSGLGFWLHLFEGEECGGQDYLFVKSTSSTDHGFLQAGLDHFLNYEGLGASRVIRTVAFDLMLPNFESPKTSEMFDKTPPNEPKRHTEAVEQKSSCEAGLQKNSVPVIVGSGHIVMLPENSIWRYGINPVISGQIFEGALTGFTHFQNGRVEGIYDGWWGIDQMGVRQHIGFFRVGSGLSDELSLAKLNAISEEFALPSGDKVETYFGEHLVLTNEDDGCNQAYLIRKATIEDPLKGFMSKPLGPLVSSPEQIGTFKNTVTAENGFYKICPSDLTEVVAGITSGADIDGYFSFGFTGGGMLYALRPGGQKFTDWVLVRRDEKTGGYLYYQWNCTLAIWQIYDGPTSATIIENIQNYYEFFQDQGLREGLHTALDIVGFAPFIGELSDFSNGTLYLVEGDLGNAGFSYLMVLIPPGVDWLGRALNLSTRLGKVAGKVKAVVKFACASAPPSLIESDAQASCKLLFNTLKEAAYRRFVQSLDNASVSNPAFAKIHNLISSSAGNATDLGIKFMNWLANNQNQFDNFARIWQKAVDDLNLPEDELLLILEDVTNPRKGLNIEFVEAVGENPELLKAWNICLAYPDFRKTKSVLEKALGVIDDGAITPDQLKQIVTNNGALWSRAEPLEELFDLLDNFGNYRGSDGFDAVIQDLMRGGGWTDGANWMLTYVKNNAEDFPPGATHFEIRTSSGREMDVFVDPIRYELKAVQTLPPGHFSTQFALDLDEVDNLENLRWIFKRDKLSSTYSTETEFVEKMLEEVRKIGLDPRIIDKIVGRPGASIEELLNLLKTKNVFRWQ